MNNTSFFGSFPTTRLRRLRQSQWLRNLTAQTALLPSDLILPLFVIEGKNKKEPITNLPNIYRYSIDLLIKEVKEAQKLGIPAVMLFPAVETKLKTADGKEAWNAKNLICRAVAAIKNTAPQIGVICDVALDPYTSHGHDGILNKKGDVANDATIDLLCKQAIVQAQAGCDIIAPSDMMDGRISAIRKALDVAGFSDLPIISYAAKYASNFYGPFRNAVGSANNLNKSNTIKDKKTYQMDFRNSDEALREIALDIAEGADMIIVKPGMPYLDIVAAAAQNFKIPTIAYQVSGEYAMLKIAANQGAFDFEKVLYESLISFKRAQATAVITYGAIDVAKMLNN